MKKVLIDTNIVLDIALERQEFKKQAQNVTRLLYDKNIPMAVTATTVTDIYYLIKKQGGHDEAIEFLVNFFDYCDIAGVTKTSILNALHSERNDFEDAVQIETAKQNEINIVITRNKKDFEDSGLEVYTAYEYVKELENE